MINLQRITTEYVESEDRIRLNGEGEDGQTIVLWLTQRLLSKVVAHLLGLIEKQSPDLSNTSPSKTPKSSLLQGFEQQAAQAELSPEHPVEAVPTSQSWLIQEVDITLNPEGTLVLVFKRDLGSEPTQQDACKASLSVVAKQLRQWLGMVHVQWQRAGWPLALWPKWMDETAVSGRADPLH
jgi:hypothetical protein